MANEPLLKPGSTTGKQVEQPPPQSNTEVSIVLPSEVNGPKGPEPTRFGDWERKGRCVDF